MLNINIDLYYLFFDIFWICLFGIFLLIIKNGDNKFKNEIIPIVICICTASWFIGYYSGSVYHPKNSSNTIQNILK